MIGLDLPREIVPEILDHLPADDPHAMASRRDLARINNILLQRRIMLWMLRRHVSARPARILEIGAGDGSFMFAVARWLCEKWPGVRLSLLDRAELITGRQLTQFGHLGWRAEAVVDDLFSWIETPVIGRYDVVCANLFLHHFSDDALSRLFVFVGKSADVFVATEPRRNRLALAMCSLLRLMGCNNVTLHDAKASVRAGFTGGELSRLWPANDSFKIKEHRVGLFTHAFIAERIR